MIWTERMEEAALRLLGILIYTLETVYVCVRVCVCVCVCVCKEGNGGRPSSQAQK